MRIFGEPAEHADSQDSTAADGPAGPRVCTPHLDSARGTLPPGTEGLNSGAGGPISGVLGLPVPGLKSKAQAQALTLSSPTVAPENMALTLLGGGHHHRGSVPRAPRAPRPPRPLPAPTHRSPISRMLLRYRWQSCTWKWNKSTIILISCVQT